MYPWTPKKPKPIPLLIKDLVLAPRGKKHKNSKYNYGNPAILKHHAFKKPFLKPNMRKAYDNIQKACQKKSYDCGR